MEIKEGIRVNKDIGNAFIYFVKSFFSTKIEHQIC